MVKIPPAIAGDMGLIIKLEIELPYDLAIPLLGIHTEETRIERTEDGVIGWHH